MKHETKKIYIFEHSSLSILPINKRKNFNQSNPITIILFLCIKSKENVQNSYAAACSRNWKSDLWRRRGGGSTSDKLIFWKDRDISSIENGML